MHDKSLDSVFEFFKTNLKKICGMQKLLGFAHRI